MLLPYPRASAPDPGSYLRYVCSVYIYMFRMFYIYMYAPVSSRECPRPWELFQVSIFRAYFHVFVCICMFCICMYVPCICMWWCAFVCSRVLARVRPLTLGAISSICVPYIYIYMFRKFHRFMYVLYIHIDDTQGINTYIYTLTYVYIYCSAGQDVGMDEEVELALLCILYTCTHKHMIYVYMYIHLCVCV